MFDSPKAPPKGALRDAHGNQWAVCITHECVMSYRGRWLLSFLIAVYPYYIEWGWKKIVLFLGVKVDFFFFYPGQPFKQLKMKAIFWYLCTYRQVQPTWPVSSTIVLFVGFNFLLWLITTMNCSFSCGWLYLEDCSLLWRVYAKSHWPVKLLPNREKTATYKTEP